MFRNRLRKRGRHLGRWARREGISCYRVYEKDIPEIPLVVDRYGDAACVSEFARRDDSRGDAWVTAMVAAIAEALEVAPDAIFWKQRARQRGPEQYQRLGDGGARFPVSEGGHQFLVNLADYLDTGLFLDHRETRARVGAEAKGTDFLNLFAYTGAFTVYAAAARARSTTTVDLSNTYLEWTADNLALNGIRGAEHRLERADVLAWLEEAPAGRWDLVVLDPPTFSNSKAMQETLDIQRDHAQLIRKALRVTRPGGVVYFSTNRRRFQPGVDAFSGAQSAVELTPDSIPPDFRDRRIHRCWRLVK